ncbi:uncharacterized protein LOC118460224 isoform X2 [Anopheles albimanus]|nr:uncharacterized protein LOC118460224 isoform X2 [Anopheles albimanus]XP_035780242.1 uncharacterized protein LOC118460224 isoform X2 [Anopheles albimanus]
MNLVAVTLVILCLALAITAAPCNEQIEIEDRECTDTEYEAYRKCIEEKKALRAKRQTTTGMPCPRVQPILPIVQTERPFEVLVPVEPLKIIRQPSLKSLDRTIIVRTEQIDDEEEDGGTEDSMYYHLPTNVTTIIRLTAVVNNTNHIHMPTTLNNTNVNNIHIYSNQSNGDWPQDTVTKDENCCTAIRPKSCHTTAQGIRCHHRRFRTCGPQCTAPIIHVQKRKRCQPTKGNCEEKIAYVPQPTEKPTCVYIDQWPFVVCGKIANMTVVCAGCYDHYGQGHEAYQARFNMQQQCIGCYDDAFDTGPLYRRGPVLRPFYYHEAPCYLTGDCPEYFDDCGYGCYGHELIDPVWGSQEVESDYRPAVGPETNVVYVSDDLEISQEPSSDWGTPTVYKCAVADGDKITVTNCTGKINNPYLAAPAEHPYYKPVQLESLELRENTTEASPPMETIDIDDVETDGSGEVDNNEVFLVGDYEDPDFNL